MIDGQLARSCLTLAVQAEAASVVTVEGLAGANGLHPLQTAFRQHHALQCGYCRPGFLVTAAASLDNFPDPTETDVREWLSGNICRCTGYQFIVDAVLSAAKVANQRRRAR
jgi:aerobic carbon-monoxide dehydrogenase small subunit